MIEIRRRPGPTAGILLALTKANGVPMKAKNRSFEGKEKGTTKPASAGGAKGKPTTGAAKPAVKPKGK